jgi:hypothetical protein
MQPEKQTWLLTYLKELEQTRFTGTLTLSYYEGNLHPKMKQTIEITKQ